MRGDFWAGTNARIVPNKSPEMSSSRRFPFTNERPETKFMSTCLYLVSFREIVTLSTDFKIGIKINSSNEISSQSTSLNFCLLQKFCNKKKKSQACHSKCHVLLRMSLTIVHKHKILLSYSWNEITFICMYEKENAFLFQCNRSDQCHFGFKRMENRGRKLAFYFMYCIKTILLRHGC